MSSEIEIRAASAQFYAALNRMANGEQGAMATIWSRAAHATALHPIGGREQGWDRIAASFDAVAAIASGGEITLTGQLIQVSGDMAYEVGTETGTLTLGGLKASMDHRVTNIYRREAGAWKLVHHHTDTSPALMDLLARLQSAS